MTTKKEERYEVEVPDTLDLAERAKLGLNHFTEMIEEKFDYEMYFMASFDCNPPIAVVHMTSLSCCQCKALEVMAMLRVMSGSKQNFEREAKMVEMMTSLLGEDGLYWIPTKDDKPWLGREIGAKEPYASVIGQGRMLYAMLAWYQYTGDSIWKKRMDKLVDGLDRLVVHKEGYAYFPIHGMCKSDGQYIATLYPRFSGWYSTEEPKTEKEGEENSLFNHQGCISGALANWYLLSGNEKALRLSGELVRFLTKPQFWGGLKEYPGVKGEEHAHWYGHFHGHINTLRAILEYAIVTNDSSLKAFVRDGYEWTRQQYIPRIGLVAAGDGQGCGCGRLIGLAVKLTDAGVGNYWEDVDGYIRNQGIEMQFTEEDTEYLLKLSEDKPALSGTVKFLLNLSDGTVPNMVSGTSTENMPKRIIGGFGNTPEKVRTGLCCSTHGNMGLYYAWEGTVRCANGVAKVNLLLNRASTWMDIDSYLPYEGKVVIRNKTAKEVFVRIPLWVDRKEVRCQIDKQQTTPVWFDNNHLRFKGLKEKDVLVIEFPMVETTEEYTITVPVQFVSSWNNVVEKSTVHTFKFKGNTLIEMSPPLPSLTPVLPITQLYKNRGHYWGNKAPMKKVKRYVSPLVITW